MKRKKIAISYAYLQNNIGDDLFVEHLCKRYPDVDFYVAETGIENPTLKALKNLKFSKQMASHTNELECEVVSKKIVKFYNKFDANVIIGGSIFMESSQNWRVVLRMFKNRIALNKNCFIIGANFGPFKDNNFLTEFNESFKNVKDICFRDLSSIAYFPDNKNVRCASDVLFSYPHEVKPSEKKVSISLISPFWLGRPVSQREKLKMAADQYMDKLVELCSEFAKKDYEISLLSFCERQGDFDKAKMIENRCLSNGVTNIKVVAYEGDANRILNEIATSEIVVATRFHAMIFGFLFEKTVYPIIYDLKQKNVLNDLHFKGVSTKLENIANVNMAEIAEILTSKNSNNNYLAIEKEIKSAIKNSEKQFLGLDKFLKG